MKVNFRKALFLFSFLCLSTQVHFAQVDANDTAVEEIDSVEEDNAVLAPIDDSRVSLRQFDEEQLANYRKKSKYNYDEDPQYETNYLRRAIFRFIQWLNKTFGINTGYNIGKLLQWVLLIGGALGLIYFLVQSSRNSIIKKERKDTFVHLETLDETVSERTLDQMLEAALNSNNRRAVVRIYFLKCLRKLDDNDEIDWRDHKTNLEYKSEISNRELVVPFNDLVSVYEHVWYGSFDFSETEYEQYVKQYRSFLANISKVSA